MAVADWVGSAWLVAVMLIVSCAVTVAGAVYRPAVLTSPAPAGLTVHVTAVLVVLARLAVISCVWPPVSVALPGVTFTVTAGIRVAVAEIDTVESPRVVAVMATVCCDGMLFGAL